MKMQHPIFNKIFQKCPDSEQHSNAGKGKEKKYLYLHFQKMPLQ